MKPFPAIFINHGGGPLPLMGQQPDLAQHMKEIAKKFLPSKPKAIVVLSAHWEEAHSVHITNSTLPLPLLYDYSGFPPETYEYKYPAPGSSEISNKAKSLLESNGIDCQLDDHRRFDHGVFVPLMIMFPEADIPVVSISLDASLDAQPNMNIGRALSPLRQEGVLVLGSGYSFHNLPAFFNPTPMSRQASSDFDAWLRRVMTGDHDSDARRRLIQNWKGAPGARICHPREEHLLPLFMVAASAEYGPGKIIFESKNMDNQIGSDHVVTGYMFE